MMHDVWIVEWVDSDGNYYPYCHNTGTRDTPSEYTLIAAFAKVAFERTLDRQSTRQERYPYCIRNVKTSQRVMCL